MPWLPTGFRHPMRFSLPSGHHLRPIRESDVDLDYPAVMGSPERLWRIYGDAWGWPPATMTVGEDQADLARHASEMVDGLSYNYAIFDDGEGALLGCVYIDPRRRRQEGEAVVSWWVVDEEVGGDLDVALATAVPDWLASHWPFTSVQYGIESPEHE